MNKLVVDAIQDERLAKVISRLDTSDRQRGKMAFVKALELLPAEARGFVSILSELRNDLVHNVNSFGFSFSTWVSSMSDDGFKHFSNSLNFGIEGHTADGNWPSEDKRLLRAFPSRLLRSIVMDRAFIITAISVTKGYDLTIDVLNRELKRVAGMVESYEAGKKSGPKET